MSDRLPLLLTIRALTDVIDASDPFSRGRSSRITRQVVRLAREMGASEEQLVDIELGALLHDLGRSAALNDVLQSPRALEPGERAIVQTHPQLGWEILRGIPGLEAAADIVHSHHERPDGRGYPRALQGDAIPLGARLIMVCAAYDAMTEDRPYRRGLPPEAACDELRRHEGTQFFAEVVEKFITLHNNGRLWENHSGEKRPGRAAQQRAA